MYSLTFICFVFSYFPPFSDFEVDITGITSQESVSTYMIQDGSVILQGDQEKYACSEEDTDPAGSDSDSDSSDTALPTR